MEHLFTSMYKISNLHKLITGVPDNQVHENSSLFLRVLLFEKKSLDNS